VTTGLFDESALCGWLDRIVPELGSGSLAVTRLAGGSSSTVLKVTRGGRDAVLRLPARPPRADSLKAMEREARILKSLGGTTVPHPRLIAYCPTDVEIGVPCLLMAFVDGWLGANAPPTPYDTDGCARRQLAYAMVDAVSSLSAVDFRAIGLTGLGKPEGFLGRQVDRWLGQIESYKVTEGHPGREIPGMDYVAEWLRRNTPPASGAGLIHGDISFANILFCHGSPARVAAIIDWEIATLGDPLLDLGRALFPMPGRHLGTGKNRMADYSGYPTREELAAYYTESTGRPTDNIDYYIVLAMFKLACIVEFNYARWATGRDRSELARQISAYVLDVIADARLIAQHAR
jgi:aminoglycoside phosphotransferase (APT) family kinase protein